MPARKKNDPAGGRPRSGVKGVHGNWVRTGGLIGDDSMKEVNGFNEGGAGVDESRIRCNEKSEDPNFDVEGGLGRLPGVES